MTHSLITTVYSQADKLCWCSTIVHGSDSLIAIDRLQLTDVGHDTALSVHVCQS